jgi:Uma2 family endonuclease
MTIAKETLTSLSPQSIPEAPFQETWVANPWGSEPVQFNPYLVDPNLPDHTQLPESDGNFVKNFQELPQSILLTDSLAPVLEELHPDGQYAIGQDSGIYWRSTHPPEKGSEAPDWFYVPRVPPLLEGRYRRSYVLSKELQVPAVILEFASGNGSEERDATPLSQSEAGIVTKPGKFWVYEQVLRTPYYGIYEVRTSKLEVYHLEALNPGEPPEAWRYRKLKPNEQGRYPIPPLQVELGVWHGWYQNQEMNWMRWWDRHGQLLLTGAEQAKQEQQRAEQEHQRAEQERQRAEQARQRAEEAELLLQQEVQARQDVIVRLRRTGMTPEQIAEILSLQIEQVLSVIQAMPVRVASSEENR